MKLYLDDQLMLNNFWKLIGLDFPDISKFLIDYKKICNDSIGAVNVSELINQMYHVA